MGLSSATEKSPVQRSTSRSPTSNKEKRVPRHRAFRTPREKKRGQWGSGGLLAVPLPDFSDES
eukprot:1099614-Pelagomonas_calceolata.AAC.2